MSAWIEKINFSDDGLIPAIAQDYHTGKVLMLAWMNKESIQETIKIGKAVYFSRSRSKIWVKGEESGHFQYVYEIRLDCDGDTILLKVKQETGIACHTGRETCFFYKFHNEEWKVTEKVIKSPKKIYVKG